MICDFCRHEVESGDTRELVVSAWCPNCGAFSHGKGPLKLPGNGEIYRETAKNAQEAGTRLWNTVVRVKNLLRGAQPYLELHPDHQQCEGDPFLFALCEEVAEEIGAFEDNATEDQGRELAERLGIDMEKWAAEIKAKVDAAVKEEMERRKEANDGIEGETGKV